MRRRPKEIDETAGMPLRLRRYDPADWIDPECHPECAYWAAVEAWRLENPTDLYATDDDRSPLILTGPDVPYRPEWLGNRLVDTAHGDRIT